MVTPQWFVARDANDALHLNPPDAQEHISTGASDWLWAAFSLITLSTLIMAVLMFMVCTVDL